MAYRPPRAGLAPFHPFPQGEPAVAEFDQPPGRIRDGDSTRVFRLVGSADVGRQADWEGEGR